MTRIEVLFKNYPILAECFSKNEIIKRTCPGGFDIMWPELDTETEQMKDMETIGCRWVTCEQCWNEEVKE